MKTIKYTFAFLAMLVTAFAATSCIEETFPQDDYLTADQVAKQPSAMQGYVNSINRTLARYGSYSSSTEWDIGYPALSIIRDINTEDFPAYTLDYDQFYYYTTASYLGEYAMADFYWVYYYKLLNNCHNILRQTFNEGTKAYFGIAHFYRAYFYFEMARMYEWKATGFDELDSEAEANGAWGLTVPILTEKSTEVEARNTPRATYYEMYRFLLDDLQKAEEYLADYTPTRKNEPNLAVVYGQMARLYLEMASRFEQAPDDLAAVKAAGVDLGANDVRGFYEKTKYYAEQAIARSGASVLSRQEWYAGFNDISSSSWMLGFFINQELLSSSLWKSWIGYVCAETTYGISGLLSDDANEYKNQRLISTALYETIPAADWRRATWIAPEDAGNSSAVRNYTTCLGGNAFAALPALTGLKFHPRNNERSDHSIGSAVDFPLMRVEELYFIKIEAEAGINGYAAGAAALTDFMNAYRYTDGSYRCKAATRAAFIDELMRQKRIEFWGEGVMAWDYKRLNLAITRGYEGTNFSELARLNSKQGYCAPWLNTYIMRSERGMNPALVANPDPSLVDVLWK